ncbi:MAG: hypothetical protein WBA74_03400 [Cyclobacteriaceae bacterium]
MKTKRLSLDDFKKKVSTTNDKLSYAKGGQGYTNNMCPFTQPKEDKCHPAAN